MLAFWPWVLWSLFLAFMVTAAIRGARRAGGSRKRSASMSTKAHGMTTPATDITEACSSRLRRGSRLAAEVERYATARYMADFGLPLMLLGESYVQTRPRYANSSTAHGWSTAETGTHGESGERPALVDCDE